MGFARRGGGGLCPRRLRKAPSPMDLPPEFDFPHLGLLEPSDVLIYGLVR